MTPEFWRIIEESMNEEGDRSLQASKLTNRLVGDGLDAVLEFTRNFDAAMNHLNTWDLWGAIYLGMGGCSDDMFEYARAWFIAGGETSAKLAGSSPELVVRSLVGESENADERWEKLRVHEGEYVLYVSGIAHERLTGEWPPPSSSHRISEPSGEPWDEDDLPQRFPTLYAALPANRRGSDGVKATRLPDRAENMAILVQASTGLQAFGEGDHATAHNLLQPLVDDPDAWEHLSGLGPEMRVDVAYAVGITLLARGDVAAAAEILRLVIDDIPDYPHIRRALAQVELARGEIGAAADLIDTSLGAIRSERALAAKVAFRRGDLDEARRLAIAELDLPVQEHEHPWDVAGSLQQFAQIFVDLGAVEEAETMALECATLLQGAPDGLPLLGHLQIVLLGIDRLRGQVEQGLEAAEALAQVLESSDLAECLRERARINLRLGNRGEAITDYRRAIELFENAGELWEAQRTRLELADHYRRGYQE